MQPLIFKDLSMNMFAIFIIIKGNWEKWQKCNISRMINIWKWCLNEGVLYILKSAVNTEEFFYTKECCEYERLLWILRSIVNTNEWYCEY